MVNKQTGKRVNDQAGVALISVLIVVALVSSSVALMLKRQNTMIDDITVVNHQANAVQYLFSLEEFAKELLKTDYEDDKDDKEMFDWDEEDWAEKFIFSLDNGQFEARLFDLQAGLNLNNLFEFNKESGQIGEKFNPDFFGCFNRLNLKLESDVTGDNIINYLNERRLSKITHLSELKKITYVDVENYDKIRQFLFVLDAPVPININTASDQIISCLHPQLDAESVIASIISARPYTNIDDFHKQLQEGVVSISSAEIKKAFSNELIDVKSNYFVLKGKITINQLVLKTVSIFRRNTSKISLIHRSYYLNN